MVVNKQVALDMNGIRMDLETIFQYHELAQETRWELQCIIRRIVKIQCELEPETKKNIDPVLENAMYNPVRKQFER